MIKKQCKTTPLSQNKGFSLIELLVVMAIIGLLSAILTVNYNGVRQRARDAKRKADLKQMQSVLELYRFDNGSYPQTSVAPYRLNTTACPGSSAFTSGSTTYIAKLPCDPLGTSGYNSGNYYYYSNGSSYTLGTCLENANDQDKTTSAPTPSGGTCSSGAYYVVTNL